MAALAIGAILALPALADTRKLAADGTVHTIDVQTVGSGKNTGTALRHTRHGAGVAAQSVLVPGTEDVVIDREPAIEIDPVSGTLFLVWSRYDAGNFNIYISRYNGTAWSAASAVLKVSGDDVEPQIRITDNYVHVGWRQILSGQSSFYRMSFLSTTLTPAYGPERVRTDDLWPVPADGASVSGTPDPSQDEKIFAGIVFSSNSTEPGKSHLWGVRDEPVPIGYRECLLLPSAVRSAAGVEAGWLGGRFTFWFVSGSRFYYATRAEGAWSPTRAIDLAAGVSAADARWIVEDMNRRSAAY